MATITFAGTAGTNGINMAFDVSAIILGMLADLTSTNRTATSVTYPGSTATLVANGTFGAYDANGDPTSGTVTSFVYSVLAGPGTAAASMEVSGLAIAVPTLFGWALSGNAAALTAALFGGDDVFTGSAANETILAYGGNDQIEGGAGNDRLVSGDGNDTVSGGSGNDSIEGGAGNDILNGGDGDDIFTNNAGLADVGIDTIDGGAGADFIEITLSGTGAQTVDASAIGAAAGITLANGTTIRNVEAFALFGSAGSDTLSIGTPGPAAFAGQTRFFGGAGTDTLVADFAGRTDSFNLVAPSQFLQGQFAGYALDSIERFEITTGSGDDSLTGGVLGDRLSGGSGADLLSGGQGADVLDGGAGNDRLEGGDGNDTLDGGAGNDVVLGGAGVDIMDGGEGTDTVALDTSGSSVGLTLSSANLGSQAGVTLANGTVARSFENVQWTAGGGDDTLSLTLPIGFGSFNAGGGNDLLVLDVSALPSTHSVQMNLFPGSTSGSILWQFGQAQTDPLFASLSIIAVERFDVRGGAGNDDLRGLDMDDVLRGGSGADAVQGNGGNDLLEGGDGADSLSGGAGNDVVRGGQGDDILIYDGLGVDDLDGGAGTNDALSLNLVSTSVGLNVTDQSFISASGVTLANGTVIRNIEALIGIQFGSGDDVLTLNTRPFAPQGFSGGGGTDRVSINLGGNAVNSGARAVDDVGIFRLEGTDYRDFEFIEVIGTGGNDLFTGTAAADRFVGNNGEDTLEGRAGNDTLLGGNGFDVLRGGAGDDVLDGGADADQLNGADPFGGPDGRDTASYASAMSGVYVFVGDAGSWTGDAAGDS